MGLLTELLLVPFAPARLALWSAGQLVESATREALDPTVMRRELADLSRRFDEGLITAEEFEAREDAILDRLEILGSPFNSHE
jgi:Gas vesicle protein G